jgi:hypothetical protein
VLSYICNTLVHIFKTLCNKMHYNSLFSIKFSF